MLRSTSSDSYWTYLATLAYKTKLLSKSGRTFLTPAHLFCPIICSAPHSSSPKGFTQVHFSWDALVVLFVDTLFPVLCWEFPLTLETMYFYPSNSAHLSLSPQSLFWVPIPTRAFMIFAVWVPCIRLLCLSHWPGCFCMMFPCCDSSWIDSVVWVFGSFFVKCCLV